MIKYSKKMAKYNKKIKLLSLAVLIFSLTSCANMPITSMIKMASMNPLEINPRDLIAVVEFPKGIDVKQGDIIVYFNFSVPEEEISFTHEFELTVNEKYPLPQTLLNDLSSNKIHRTFTLQAEDAEIMREGQKVVNNYRATSDKGSGSFQLSLNSACRNQRFEPAVDKALNVHLKTKQGEDFFTFIDEADVTDLDKYNKKASPILAVCN